MKFVFNDERDKCWIVEAQDKHNAIAIAVENGYTCDMSNMYYGLDDGQISVKEVKREIIVRREQ